MKTILQCLITLCLIPSLTSYADDDHLTKPAFKDSMIQAMSKDKDTSDLKKRIYPCIAEEITDRVFLNGEVSLSKEIVERRLDALNNNDDSGKMMLVKCMVATGVIVVNPSNGNLDSPNPTAAAHITSVNDVLLDYDALVGQTRRIKGFILSAGEINMIFQTQTFGASLLVDTSKLSRDDRKKLLSDCAQGCNMTLDGVIGKVLYGKGIKATKLWY